MHGDRPFFASDSNEPMIDRKQDWRRACLQVQNAMTRAAVIADAETDVSRNRLLMLLRLLHQ